jgi:SPP1 gp7 family putative phage head morphogenesis protein
MADENIILEPLPFEEAISFFRDKIVLSDAEFYALAEAARAEAFTIAGVARMDILMDVRGALDKAIEAGETLADFQGRLGDIMETRGWQGLTPWHTETVFRNNIQTAYSVGRYKQMAEQVDRFPYWEYDAVNDSRTRPTHAALDGKIFPADHPFWDTWYPPNGHRCRCSVNPVHKYVAEEEGLKIETEDPTGGLIEPVDPVTGVTMPARPLIPDPGWGHNPAKEAWQPDLSKYPDKLREQFEGGK